MFDSTATITAGAQITPLSRLRAGLRHSRRSPVGTLGAIMVPIVVITALFASVLAPWNPRETDLYNVLKGPSSAHLLGTDELGRDILSRTLLGARPALMVSLISVSFAVLIGVPIGMLSGYFPGILDTVIGRVLDAFLSFPTLVLALAIAAVFGTGLVTTIVALSFVYWPQMARLVRGQTISLRERDWVRAAKSLGASTSRILFRHIAPNLGAVVIVASSINLASAILIEAALSFLGLGVPPPTPSWGLMLRTGYAYLEESMWPSLIPGVAIFLMVLGFNFLGDGLRDYLDPKLRRV